jgi:two-component system sensor kinase FixL
MVESERARADGLREELAHLGRVAMLDVLSGSLAHEITQPLTAIRTNAEVARRLADAGPAHLDELKEVLDEVVSDNKRAAEVVQRMRSLLKKEPVRYEPIELGRLVADVVSLIRSNAMARRIALDVELAPDLEPVLGDRVQIQQVVLNLLLNALDAVQDREAVDRHVRLRTSKRGAEALVEVIDRGGGASDADLERMFEPFYTTKPHGMGIGLSICRMIVDAHDGTLRAIRNAGAGLTLVASFPLPQSNQVRVLRSTTASTEDLM